MVQQGPWRIYWGNGELDGKLQVIVSGDLDKPQAQSLAHAILEWARDGSEKATLKIMLNALDQRLKRLEREHANAL